MELEFADIRGLVPALDKLHSSLAPAITANLNTLLPGLALNRHAIKVQFNSGNEEPIRKNQPVENKTNLLNIFLQTDNGNTTHIQVRHHCAL